MSDLRYSKTRSNTLIMFILSSPRNPLPQSPYPFPFLRNQHQYQYQYQYQNQPPQTQIIVQIK